jgi:glycine hydroxymethyltransferase
MQACSGAAMRGSVQQPIWTKGSNFIPKGSCVVGFPQHVKVNSLKPCRCSRIEGSLVTGRPPSSLPVPEIGGSILYNEFLKEKKMYFLFVYIVY